MKTPGLPLGRLWFALLAAGGLTAAEPAWQPLFNGHDLAGWETFMSKPDQTWEVPGLARDASGKYLEPIGMNRDPLRVFVIENVDGRPAIHISGQGFGVLSTITSYGNFHLRLQVKWGERRWGDRVNAPRDSGLMYFVHSAPGVTYETWPRSIEFQIQEHDFGDLFAVASAITVPARAETVGGKTLYHYDSAGQLVRFLEQPPVGNRCVRLEDVEKPRGEWNTLDLICLNGDSIHVVNGKVVMRLLHAERLDGAAPAPLTAGQISLQTEGAEVFYRDVELQPITTIPAEYAGK